MHYCGWRKESVVPIAEEEAVIVWDAPHKIEHFIRRATFETAKPFGFLSLPRRDQSLRKLMKGYSSA